MIKFLRLTPSFIKKIILFITIIIFVIVAYFSITIVSAYTDYDSVFRFDNMISDDSALDIGIYNSSNTFRDIFGDSIFGDGKTNLIDNGNLSLDSDSDGLGDNFLLTGTGGSAYISNHIQYRINTVSNTTVGFRCSGGNWLYNHHYFTSFDIDIITVDNLDLNVYVGASSPYVTEFYHINSYDYYSNIFVSDSDRAQYLKFYWQGNSDIGEFGAGNLVVYDLTDLFGAGNEVQVDIFDNYLSLAEYFSQTKNDFDTSFYYAYNGNFYYISANDYLVIDLTKSFGTDIPNIDVFESEYLTQCDTVFDICQNYEDTSDVELGNDFQNDITINSLDYDTSVVGYYGSNVDVNFWGILENDLAFGYPVPSLHVYYQGILYNYDAIIDGYKFYFDLTDIEKTRIKRILFDRRDNDYFTFVFPARVNGGYGFADFYFQIETDFFLNASINNLYLGTYQNTFYSSDNISSYDYDLRNIKDLAVAPYSGYIDVRMFDNNDMRQTYTRLEYHSDLDNTNNIESRLYTFPNKFTNVQNILLSFNPYSIADVSGLQPFYMQFYELGIFSDSDIVNPDYNSVGISGDYFTPEYQTVEWYDFFGHVKNAYNYVVFDNAVSHTLQDIYSDVVSTFVVFKTSFDLISGISIIGLIIGIGVGFMFLRKT